MPDGVHGHDHGQQSRMHDVESSEHGVKVHVAALEEPVLEIESRLPRN